MQSPVLARASGRAATDAVTASGQPILESSAWIESPVPTFGRKLREESARGRGITANQGSKAVDMKPGPLLGLTAAPRRSNFSPWQKRARSLPVR